MKVTSHDDCDGPVYNRPTIVVHPLKENKRPIGFAPWPDPPKPKKPAKRKKAT